MPAFDLEFAARPDEAIVPGVAREEHPYPAIRIDPEEGDVGVTIGAQIDAGVLTGVVRIFAAVGPDLHAGTIEMGGGDDCRRQRAAAEGGEQHDGSEHMTSDRPQTQGTCRARHVSKSLICITLGDCHAMGDSPTVLYHGHATVSSFREP